MTGLPKNVTITSEGCFKALQEPIEAIIDGVKGAGNHPPELAADIVNNGIVMTGGGSLLDGLDELLSRETNLPVHIADDAISCVARGTGKALEEMSVLKGTKRRGLKRLL